MSTDKRCGATTIGPDGKIRCQLPAFHPKQTWHRCQENGVRAEWNDDGSSYIEVPTHRSAA